MKTTGCALVFLLGACSGRAPTENTMDGGAPAAEVPDSGPPAVDCSASSPDAGTELYQGRPIPIIVTRRGCPITIDYQLQ